MNLPGPDSDGAQLNVVNETVSKEIHRDGTDVSAPGATFGRTDRGIHPEVPAVELSERIEVRRQVSLPQLEDPRDLVDPAQRNGALLPGLDQARLNVTVEVLVKHELRIAPGIRRVPIHPCGLKRPVVVRVVVFQLEVPEEVLCPGDRAVGTVPPLDEPPLLSGVMHGTAEAEGAGVVVGNVGTGPPVQNVSIGAAPGKNNDGTCCKGRDKKGFDVHSMAHTTMNRNGLTTVARTIVGMVAVLCGLLLIGFLVALLPELFSIRLQHIVVRLGQPLAKLTDYLRSAAESELFAYQAGTMSRSFLTDVGPYWLNSFLYLFGGLGLGLVAGVATGMTVARYDLKRLEGFLGSLGLVPDFLLALLLQFAVIGITVATGVRIARVASVGSQTALLLPFIVMTLYPAVATMLIAADRVHHFRGEQFVGNLVARGISRRRIYRRHLLPGVLDGVKRDLPRILGTHAATLFIVERVFQSRGLVKWMFAYAFTDQGPLQLGGYQFAFMVHCLVALITVVIASYILARLGMALTLAVSQHA